MTMYILTGDMRFIGSDEDADIIGIFHTRAEAEKAAVEAFNDHEEEIDAHTGDLGEGRRALRYDDIHRLGGDGFKITEVVTDVRLDMGDLGISPGGRLLVRDLTEGRR